jgi:hypothetical protein
MSQAPFTAEQRKKAAEVKSAVEMATTVLNSVEGLRFSVCAVFHFEKSTIGTTIYSQDLMFKDREGKLHRPSVGVIVDHYVEAMLNGPREVVAQDLRSGEKGKKSTEPA